MSSSSVLSQSRSLLPRQPIRAKSHGGRAARKHEELQIKLECAWGVSGGQTKFKCLIEEIKQGFSEFPIISCFVDYPVVSHFILFYCMDLAEDWFVFKEDGDYDPSFEEQWHELILWIIAQNPYALLWKGYDEVTTALQMLFRLNPRIIDKVVQEYSWIFSHEHTTEPFHFHLFFLAITGHLREASNISMEDQAGIPREILWKLYVQRPELLLDTHNGKTVFHKFLSYFPRIYTTSPRSFFWELSELVSPESMETVTDMHGRTLLFTACQTFRVGASQEFDWNPFQAEELYSITQLLLIRYPRAILIKDKYGELPIESLIAVADTDSTLRGIARKLIISMLQQLHFRNLEHCSFDSKSSDYSERGLFNHSQTISNWLDPIVKKCTESGKESFAWNVHLILKKQSDIQEERQLVKHILESSVAVSVTSEAYLSWNRSKYLRLRKIAQLQP